MKSCTKYKSGLGILLSLTFLVFLAGCDSTTDALGTIEARLINKPTPTSQPTLKPPRPTSTPRPTPIPEFVSNNLTNIKVVVPTAAVGELITNTDWYSRRTHIRLRKTDEVAKPYQAALDVIYNSGTKWAFGGQLYGRQLTIEVTYGRGDIGYINSRTGLWENEPNYQSLCRVYTKCTPEEKKYDYFEDRPLWIVNYGNIDKSLPVFAGGLCGTQQCHSLNHKVIAVDMQRNSIIYNTVYDDTRDLP